MRAALYKGPRAIEVGERPDPVITAPTDALVRVVLSCVCGSDLWYYRGESPHDLGPIGHEFIGVVEEVGAEVRGFAKGDFVIAPFIYCDGTCAHCRAGVTSRWSATARSVSAACWRRNGWARRASSPSAGTHPARRWRGSSARPTSWPSAATRRSTRCSK